MDENTVYAENSAIKISEDVVQTIAAMAIKEVQGLDLPAASAEGFVEKLVKKNFSKGIKVEMNEKTVSLEIHVNVEYGAKIQPLAAELQEVVKRNIETMTDLTVLAVDVYVEGITVVKEAKKTEEPEEIEQ